jgi:hypothetical protein
MVKKIKKKGDKMHFTKDANLVDFVGSHKRPAFITIIPTFGMVPIEFHTASLRLATPTNAKSQVFTIRGEEIGKARNFAVHHLLSGDFLPEFFFFFGDDIIPEWDSLLRLYDEAVGGKWDVLGALYHLKREGTPTPILWRDELSGPLVPHVHFEPGEVVWSDIVGMDFTLIRPEIFRGLSEPYFLTGPRRDEASGSIEVFTEDAYFCQKAKIEKGAKMGVHTGIRVAHMDISTGEIY